MPNTSDVLCQRCEHVYHGEPADHEWLSPGKSADVRKAAVGQIWVIPKHGPMTVTFTNAHYVYGKTLLRSHKGLCVPIMEQDLLNRSILIYDPALPAQSLAA